TVHIWEYSSANYSLVHPLRKPAPTAWTAENARHTGSLCGDEWDLRCPRGRAWLRRLARRAVRPVGAPSALRRVARAPVIARKRPWLPCSAPLRLARPCPPLRPRCHSGTHTRHRRRAARGGAVPSERRPACARPAGAPSGRDTTAMHNRDDVEAAAGRDGADGTVWTIGLWADPGMPRQIAARIADGLATGVSEAVGAPWRVEITQGELPLSPDGTIPVLGRAPRLRHQHGWEYLVYLTDLPRYTEEGHPVLCETDLEAGVALISLPALGAAQVSRRARRLAVSLVTALHESRTADPTAIAAASGGARVRQTRSEEGGVLLSAAEGPFTGTRMLAGMLRSNRPGRLLPALTGCLAVAVAAGAFGIFYGTLATVADPLSIPRMLLISALVISLRTAWLILRNGLWSTRDDPSQMWRRHLDNVSTVITVGVSVVLLYLVVVLLMLVL